MAEAVPFAYERPLPDPDRPKQIVVLGQTDMLHAHVQVVAEGGENNLHAHPRTDGFWYVVAGSCRFYGPDDVVLADLGAQAGMVIPHGTKYWFESTGDEPLEILHVAVRLHRDVDLVEDRVNITPLTDGIADMFRTS